MQIVLKLLEAQDPLDSVGGLSTGLPQEPEAARCGVGRKLQGKIGLLPRKEVSFTFPTINVQGLLLLLSGKFLLVTWRFVGFIRVYLCIA